MSRTGAIAETVRAHPGVRYVAFPESSGVSESRNRIVQLAETAHLLFVDADAVPRPGWAAALTRALAAGHTLVGARIVPRWPARPPWLLDTAPARELLGNLDCGDAPCLLPRVMGTSFGVDLERVAPAPFSLDVGHRPGRWLGQEEVRLSLDVLAAGGTIGYEPGAVVDHHIRPERARWRWMAQRIVHEGQTREPALEPFPRRLDARDRAFQIATAPLFAGGRLRGRAA
jgi:hypothetical protein